MDDPNAPSLWLIMGLGLALMGGFILVLWVVNRLAGHPKSGRAPEDEHAAPVRSHPIAEAKAEVRPSLLADLMSLILGQAGPVEAATTPLPAPPPIEAQRMAKPGNGVNDALTGNMLPEEVRDVVRFWAMVESAERIIAGGKIGQTEAIELVFNCKRSGRADSLYARARSALNARTEANYRANQARLVELQAAAEEA
jgi:hypothetical protein